MEAIGTFFDAVPSLPDSISNYLTVVLAAPMINNVWNSERVVVAKVSKASFANTGFPIDPCDGDTLFTAATKFCDADGNAFILQAIPENDALAKAPALDTSAFLAVPGFDNLTNFLTVETITQSANNLQNTALSFQALPPTGTDAATQVLNAFDPNNGGDLTSAAFFNLPVCNLDFVQIDSGVLRSRLNECKGRFKKNVETCIFNGLLLCGCPLITVGDLNWPYDTTASPSSVCDLQ